MMLISYRWFASFMHGKQQYAGRQYDYHLDRVEEILVSFGYDTPVWRARARLHDVIEDCMKWAPPWFRRLVIRVLFGQEVSDPVWDVTGIGPNRKARNQCIYDKVSISYNGSILKCADRTANVEASLRDPETGTLNGSMARMYMKERRAFAYAVQPNVPEAMWARLEKAYNDIQATIDAEC